RVHLFPLELGRVERPGLVLAGRVIPEQAKANLVEGIVGQTRDRRVGLAALGVGPRLQIMRLPFAGAEVIDVRFLVAGVLAAEDAEAIVLGIDADPHAGARAWRIGGSDARQLVGVGVVEVEIARPPLRTLTAEADGNLVPRMIGGAGVETADV